MQFNREEIPKKKESSGSIESLASEEERREYIQKSLQLHMLENREAHQTPQGQTLFSFTQGNPDAVIGKQHAFAKAFGEEEQKSQQTQRQATQQQSQQKQEHDQWQPSSRKQEAAPVRTCPCCARFLTEKFGMSEKDANTFMKGAETTTGYRTAGGNYSSDSGSSYNSSGGYSSGSSSSSYSSSTGYDSNKKDYV